MFSFNRFFPAFSAVLFAVLLTVPPPASAGLYAGVDAAFVSSKTEGTVVGPIDISVAGSPPISVGSIPYGGTDELPGGSLFAGYSKTFGGIFFVAGELNGGYGSYEDTKAFTNNVFTSEIDVTQGYLGATARVGTAIPVIPGNMRVYASLGWAHNWIEAEGSINTFSLLFPPDPSNPTALVPVSINVGRSVKTDLTFDGISYGVGIEYGISSLIPLLKNASLRLAYSRIEYAEEKFSYDASALAGDPLMAELPGVGRVPVNITNTSIPAEADSGVHVLSLGLSYRLGI